MSSQALSKKFRLRTSREFQAHFNQIKKKLNTPYFSLLTKPNNLSISRLGISLSKKKVPLAVNRNRIKRLVRESFRKNKLLLVGIDIVVIGQKESSFASNEKILLKLEQQWNDLVHFYRQFSSKQ